MLRNSTQKFREKYENRGSPAYCSTALFALRQREGVLGQGGAMSATWNKNVKDSARSAKKLETTGFSRANKARHM